MQSTVAEVVVTIPEGIVTGSFTGKAQWSGPGAPILHHQSWREAV
jgi:hypothetical protein